jgi:hypothetical protein
MAVGLNVKTPGSIFTSLVHAYKDIKIGLAAYKNYLDTCLEQNLAIINAIYGDDSSDISPSSLVPVALPLNDSGDSVLVAASISDLRALASGEVDSIHGSSGNREYDINIDDWSGYSADQIAGLQGQTVLYGAALKANMNDAFDASAVMDELAIRGFKTNDYLDTVSSAVGAGLTWSDVLKMVSDSNTVEETESGEFIFHTDAFSNVSGFELAIKQIGATISGFFQNISFSISKIGEFFKSLWDGLVNVATWIIQQLFGDLRTAFTVNNNYTVESFDIPIAKAKFSVSYLTSKASLSIGDPNRYGVTKMCRGNVSVPYDAFHSVDKGGTVYFKPDLIALLNHIDSYIPHGSLYVVPWCRGHIVLSRQEDNLEVFYFLGDFSITPPVVNWSIGANGDMEIQSVNSVFSKYLTATEFRTDEAFCEWFINQFQFGAASAQDTSNMTLYNVTEFVGVGDVLINTAAVFPLRYDFSNIDSPRSIIDACDRHYYHYDYSVNPMKLLLTALVIVNASQGDEVYGHVMYVSPSNKEEEVEYGFKSRIFLPYTNHVSPVFKYHAQTDAERTKEVLDAFKAVAISAAAIGATIGVAKHKKKLKKKALYKQAEADRLWLDAVEIPDTPETAGFKQMAINDAYKATKKARKLSVLAGLVAGDTANSQINNSLRDSIKETADSVTVVQSLIR